MIVCSSNELDALSRRAARGAGFAWGLAEEAGKAVRWLAVRRLPSANLVARHLSRSDGAVYGDHSPQIDGERWAARSGNLCPVITGATLSDRARDIVPGKPVVLASVAFPLLLSAFLGRAAKAVGQGFEIFWPGLSIRCRPDGLSIDVSDEAALEVERAADVTVRAASGDPVGRPMQRHPTSVEVAPEDWAVLKALAARTYVPATEESRMRGAGAGLMDTD